MDLEFEQEYPCRVIDVVRCVMQMDIEKSGAQFSVQGELSPERLAELPHRGTIPGEAEVPVPGPIRRILRLKWLFHYEWDPTSLTKKWKIEPLVFQDQVACHGISTYSDCLTDHGPVTIRCTKMTVQVNTSGLYRQIVEREIGERLKEEAQKDRDVIMKRLGLIKAPGTTETNGNAMAHTRPGQINEEKGGAPMKQEVPDRRLLPLSVDELNSPWKMLWNLSPFWFGAVSASLVSGYFIGHSEYVWVVPIVFGVLLLPSLFAIAFASLSIARKNAYGLFLALFSIFFLLGSFIPTPSLFVAGAR